MGDTRSLDCSIYELMAIASAFNKKARLIVHKWYNGANGKLRIKCKRKWKNKTETGFWGASGLEGRVFEIYKLLSILSLPQDH